MRKWISFLFDDFDKVEKQLTFLADRFDNAFILTDRYNFPSGMYARFGKFKILAGFGGLNQVNCSICNLESEINRDDWYFGYISYNVKSELFNLPEKDDIKATVNFEPLHFFRPQYVIKIDNGSAFLGYDPDYDNNETASKVIEQIIKVDIQNDCKVISKARVINKVEKEDYFNAVKGIKEHILRGDIYEINYCIEFVAENLTSKAQDLFSNMMELSPMPFSAFIKKGNQFVLCASPERYLKKDGNRLLSMPMKGTSKRESNDFFENEGETILKNSTKEQSENIMITDLVRNDLSKVAKAGSVKVEELCGIYPFPGVYQMVSTISCEIKNGTKWAEPLRCSFPMGSMTGAPKQRALEIIDVFETGARGLYSGAIGYITPERDFDFNVVIRSLFYNSKSKTASFWVGSAITYESLPENEYNECLLKANVMMKLLNQ